MPDRRLAWSACHNARDVGGYPTVDGRQVRWGALLRADNLCRLTEAGQAALRAYGVRTIVDLRRGYELAAAVHPFAGGFNNGVYAVGEACVKLYRVDDRRRWEREWRALTFLAAPASGYPGPDLAPRPLGYDEAWAPLLGRFRLAAASQERFRAARRLAALFWLTILWRPALGRPEERIEARLRRVDHLLAFTR